MAKDKTVSLNNGSKIPSQNQAGIKDNSPKIHQKSKLKNPLNIRELNWTDKQKAFLDLAFNPKVEVLIIRGCAGTSKAQPLDAKILTKNGWVLMGDLKIGDKILTEKGDETTVLRIFPQGIKNVNKVIFSDGSSTECCDEHLWLTQDERERNRLSRVKGAKRGTMYKNPRDGEVRDLIEIKNSLQRKRDNSPNHSIPMVSNISFEEKKHLIHPYILGVLIGDGCLRQNVKITSADPEIIDYVSSFLPDSVKINQQKGKIEYSIVRSDGGIGMYRPNPFTEELKRLGLFGCMSYEKFIPDEYLFDSLENRIALLQGLMDTDGTTTKYYTSYTTTSFELIEDFKFLINSLGGTGITNKHTNNYYKDSLGNKKKGRDSYILSVKLSNDILPFKLKRKIERLGRKTKYFPIRFITDIQTIGQKECQCILVDNPTHLYITDDFLVTHNTAISIFSMLTLLSEKKVSDIVLVRSNVESADSKMGYLPGSSFDKMEPYMMPFFDKLDMFLSKQEVKNLQTEERITAQPLGFLRGLDFQVKALCLDEAQNASVKEILTFMSRIGRFCKTFICGDVEQVDIKNTGFETVYNLFNNQESRDAGIYCWEFSEEDIMRSNLCKFITKKFRELNNKKVENKNGKNERIMLNVEEYSPSEKNN